MRERIGMARERESSLQNVSIWTHNYKAITYTLRLVEGGGEEHSHQNFSINSKEREREKLGEMV